jgi:hypothetical protein
VWILKMRKMTMRIVISVVTIVLCMGLSIGVSAQSSAAVTCTDLSIPERYNDEVYWLDDHTVAFNNFNNQSIGDLFRPYYRWYTYNVLTDTLSVFSEWELPPGEIPRELVGTPARSPSPFAAMPLPPELVGVIPHSEQTMRDIHALSNDRAIIFPRDVDADRVRLWYLDRQTGMQTDLGIELYRIFPKRAFWSANQHRAVLGDGSVFSLYNFYPFATYSRTYLLTAQSGSIVTQALDQLPEWQAENLHLTGFSIFGLRPDGSEIFILTLDSQAFVFNLSTQTWRIPGELPTGRDWWVNNDEYIAITPERMLVRINLQTETRTVLAEGDALYPFSSQGRVYGTWFSPTWEYYFARWSMPRRADQHLEDIGYVVCRVPWVNAAITTTPTLSRSAAGQTIRATLMHAGTVTIADPRTIGADGRITLPRIPYGAYTLWVKHAQHLGVSRAVTVDAASVDAPFPPLRTGDVNDDNRVTLADFSILSAAFGAAAGAPAFDPRADLNGDGAVSISDYTLLAGSFGQVGVPDPSAPEGTAVLAVADPAPVELRVTPASVRIGQTVTLTLRAGREGGSIDGAGVRLRFDAARFAVESVTAGRNFDRTLLLTWDNAAGTVDAALGRLGGRVGGRFTLLTVRLRALSAGESAVTVEDGLVTTAGSVTPLSGSVTLTVR